MVTQNRAVLSVAVAALVSMTLIGNAAAVTLRKPVENGVIAQNDPTVGCAGGSYGDGFKLDFRWSRSTSPNFAYYHLVVQHASASPIIDDNFRKHRFISPSCGFVIDSNLANWHWQVTVFDQAGNLLETSELRSFSFAPCRLSSGQACNAAP
ncbi:MAG: hypothetical protein ABI541_05915 [Betaproteobacteria bacterium]